MRCGNRRWPWQEEQAHSEGGVQEWSVTRWFIISSTCTDSQTGITATHRLPFELKAPTHAKFDKDEAIYHWTISSRTLRQLMEHFGPGIELLDVNTEDDGVVNFTCFTEKQVNLNNEGEQSAYAFI